MQSDNRYVPTRNATITMDLNSVDVPVSADVPDWSRERKASLKWDPSRSLLASVRAYQRYSLSQSFLAVFLKQMAKLRHRFWSIVTSADIPLHCEIGGGILMPHPNGIVIHPDAKLGPNCLVFQQVTIGMRNGGVPVVKGHVDIGAGAKLLGKITIGNHSKIGANAVVLCDVPDHAIAVGVPAVVKTDSALGRPP
jgi:serine O-acetyltransferase